MGQTRFLSEVHERVRHAAASGAIIDAYWLADELIADDLTYMIERRDAVDTVLAACVVYGASLLLDPGPRAPSPPRERGAPRETGAPRHPAVRRRDPGPALAEA